MAYVYRAERKIDASPEQVWAVLVDLPAYPAWNPFTTEVLSSLEVGAPVDMRVVMKGLFTLSQREWLEVYEPPRCLVWAMWSPLPWLLCARREQTVEPWEGGSRYVTTDVIGGVLAGLVDAIFGRALHAGFAGVADGLVARVQRGRDEHPGGSAL